jgi:hypothetical protein
LADPAARELLAMHREAVERTRERADPCYRRPSNAAEQLADLVELRDRRALLARARRGDQTALRVLAGERIELDELLNEAKAANAVTEAEICADARAEQEEEELAW